MGPDYWKPWLSINYCGGCDLGGVDTSEWYIMVNKLNHYVTFSTKKLIHISHPYSVGWKKIITGCYRLLLFISSLVYMFHIFRASVCITPLYSVISAQRSLSYMDNTFFFCCWNPKRKEETQRDALLDQSQAQMNTMMHLSSWKALQFSYVIYLEL